MWDPLGFFASFLTLSYITAQTGHIYEYHYFSHQVSPLFSSAKMYDFNYENTQDAPYRGSRYNGTHFILEL